MYISTSVLKLQALDLSNNRLKHLGAYRQLRNKCPNLKRLNLSENLVRFFSMRCWHELNLMKVLVSSCLACSFFLPLPLLSALPLSAPPLLLSVFFFQLHSFQDMEAIGSLPSLESLVLESNPLRHSSKDSLSYASSVRKFFPGLQELVSVCLCFCDGWFIG